METRHRLHRPAPAQPRVRLHRRTEKRYLTDLLADEAVAFVERHHEKPFFLYYLAFNAPHSPLQASPEYLKRVPHLKGRRQTYAAR